MKQTTDVESRGEDEQPKESAEVASGQSPQVPNFEEDSLKDRTNDDQGVQRGEAGIASYVPRDIVAMGSQIVTFATYVYQNLDNPDIFKFWLSIIGIVLLVFCVSLKLLDYPLYVCLHCCDGDESDGSRIKVNRKIIVEDNKNRVQMNILNQHVNTFHDIKPERKQELDNDYAAAATLADRKAYVDKLRGKERVYLTHTLKTDEYIESQLNAVSARASMAYHQTNLKKEQSEFQRIKSSVCTYVWFISSVLLLVVSSSQFPTA